MQPVFADQFHYNNFLMGTRAMGLGGAFTAVSDDASGLFYNPAGLAFALSNDISGSANALYDKKTTYEDAIGGEKFIENSGGSLPSFFGGLQKLDRYVPKAVFAFGTFNTDGDLKDQNTLYENLNHFGTRIERYHRTINARSSTFQVGAAVGYRIRSNLAVGFGLNYFKIDELVQEYQDVKQEFPINIDGQSYLGTKIYTQNVREHLNAFGVQPALGIQVLLPAGFALGLSYKQSILASESLTGDYYSRSTYLTPTEKAQFDQRAAPGGLGSADPFRADESIVGIKADNALGAMPVEIRAGAAWFASPAVLWTFDVTHHTGVKVKQFAAVHGRPKYQREPTTNLASGVEYFVMPSFPLRLGIFTNNDARPEVAKGDPKSSENSNPCLDPKWAKKYCDQSDHIDYMGGSLFIAWVQPNSQVAAGVVMQQGEGQGQKSGGYLVQSVKGTSNTFAFSATHNF